MKTIEEAFPDCKQEGHWLRYTPSYEALLESAGPKILVNVTENDYQGSTYVLVEMNGQYGYLSFGWGSCSGCDSLQAAESHKDLEDIRHGLFNGVSWYESKEELLEAIAKEYEATDRWYGRDEKVEFVRKCRTYFGVES